MYLHVSAASSTSLQSNTDHNLWPSLPTEILEIIFLQLLHSDLARGRLVCTQWQKCIDQHPQLKKKSLLYIFDASDWKCYLKPLNPSLEKSHHLLDRLFNRPDPYIPQKQVWQTHNFVLIPSEIEDQPLSYPLLKQIVAGSEKRPGFDLCLEFEPVALSVVGIGPESFWLCVRRRKLTEAEEARYQRRQFTQAGRVQGRARSTRAGLNFKARRLNSYEQNPSRIRQSTRFRYSAVSRHNNKGLEGRQFGFAELCLMLFAYQAKGDNLDYWLPRHCFLGVKGERIVVKKNGIKLEISEAPNRYEQLSAQQGCTTSRITTETSANCEGQAAQSASSSEEDAS